MMGVRLVALLGLALAARAIAADSTAAMEHARELAGDGRWRASARVLRDARAASPASAELCVELARVETSRGRQAAAAHAWRAAFVRGARDADTLAALGRALAAASLAKKADAIFVRRGRLPPPLDASARAWWGAALEDLGRPAVARARYEQALALGGDDALARARLGALLAADPASRARAFELLRGVLAGAPDAAVLAAAGRGLAAAGQVADGADLVRRALGAASRADRPRLDAELAKLTAAVPRAAAPASAPNVVLVVVDTVRADHLGCFGYARATSPSIDALAAGGATFTHASSQAPWTAASIASLLSGVDPSVHGLDGGVEWRGGMPGGALPFTAQRTIAVGVPMLASMLRAAGYRTAGFVSNVYVNSIFGFGSGFDVFADDHADYSADVLARKRRGDETLTLVGRWLDTKPAEPFLLFVHLNDPHWPYDPPPPFGSAWTAEYRGRIAPRDTGFVVESEGRPVHDLGPDDLAYLIGLYDGEIAFADSLVGDLGRRLGAAGLTRPVVTVLASDHGEEFLDHGSTSHGYTLFEEQTHVPLVVSAPGRIAPVRVDAPVELVDVVPTVLDLAGVAVPPGLQGRSLLALVRGAGEARDATFSEAPLRGRLRAVRRADGRKLIRNDVDGSARVFDLGTDPGERRAGDAAHDDALAARLETWSAGNRDARAALVERGGSVLHAPLDDATRKRLEALGYLHPGAPDE